eukprot:918607-Pleurochrysis_carterae.AAC.1
MTNHHARMTNRHASRTICLARMTIRQRLRLVTGAPPHVRSILAQTPASVSPGRRPASTCRPSPLPPPSGSAYLPFAFSSFSSSPPSFPLSPFRTTYWPLPLPQTHFPCRPSPSPPIPSPSDVTGYISHKQRQNTESGIRGRGDQARWRAAPSPPYTIRRLPSTCQDRAHSVRYIYHAIHLCRVSPKLFRLAQ